MPGMFWQSVMETMLKGSERTAASLCGLSPSSLTRGLEVKKKRQTCWGGNNENGLHWFMHLNTWSPDGRPFGGGL